MFTTENLVEIISGRKRGIVASTIRGGLGLLTPIYRLGIGWRNRRFDRAVRQPGLGLIKSANVPVISIGNLTTGGTGKTPHVIWVTRMLQKHQRRVVVVSRGYGAKNSDPADAGNDEAIEMKFRLPNIPHLQSPDRHRMTERAEIEFSAQAIVLDDGFQHRQLHRDLDIVLIDATNPFGYGRLLPRGLLREPVANLCRADVIVITRCDLVDADIRKKIQSQIVRANNSALIVQTRTQPERWIQSGGQTFPLERLHGNRAFVFCGIGNPDGFRQTLASLALEVCGQQNFADHHHFTEAELKAVATQAKKLGAAALVCTHKDLVKVRHNQIDGLPVYALLIEVGFIDGQKEFEAEILKKVEGPPPLSNTRIPTSTQPAESPE